jgi:hypothetical protein
MKEFTLEEEQQLDRAKVARIKADKDIKRSLLDYIAGAGLSVKQIALAIGAAPSCVRRKLDKDERAYFTPSEMEIIKGLLPAYARACNREPSADASSSLDEGAADVVSKAATLVVVTTQATADGHVTPYEHANMERAVDALGQSEAQYLARLGREGMA